MYFILDVYFMPCSGLTGANMKEQLDPSVCSWYRYVKVCTFYLLLF